MAPLIDFYVSILSNSKKNKPLSMFTSKEQPEPQRDRGGITVTHLLNYCTFVEGYGTYLTIPDGCPLPLPGPL